MSQFSACVSARERASSSGTAASAAGRPARTIAMPAGHRECLCRGSRRRAGGQVLEHGRDSGCAAGVVEAADDELAFEPGREHVVSLAELLQRALDDVHRVDPPEQRRVRLRHLERDLSAFARLVGQPQRLLQAHAGRLAPRACLRASRRAQDVHPLRGGGGSHSARSKRAAAVCGAPLSIAACAASCKRFSTQPSPAGATPTRCAATCPDEAPSACNRRGCGAMKRVAPPLPSDASSPSRTIGWMKRGGSSRARTSRRTRPAARRAASSISIPAIAAAWRSSQPSPSTASACTRPSACGSRPRDPGDDSPGNPLAPAGQQLRRIEPGRRPPAELDRPHQLARVQGVAPLAVQTAAHSSSLAPSPTAARTIAPTAPSLSSAGRTTADASSRRAASDGLVSVGSPSRTATSNAGARPSSRGAR